MVFLNYICGIINGVLINAYSGKPGTNDSINIPVLKGNYIEFMSKSPGFVTQPTTSIWAGTVYIE
jgi:hypothetical protein